MPEENELFSVLDCVDSSNNYAMGQVHAALAKHGQAWYAREQQAGKGQRGKSWQSAPDENIILSIALKPALVFHGRPFYLSALVACVCRQFFASLSGEDVKIKWPNDIYWRDRKTGGILIENIFRGEKWDWAIIGIGININQIVFDDELANAASLKTITGKNYNPLDLAKQLHKMLMDIHDKINDGDLPGVLKYYNEHLYKKDEAVSLRKGNAIFESKIVSVNEYGQLLTADVMERVFDFGEVGWVK